VLPYQKRNNDWIKKQVNLNNYVLKENNNQIKFCAGDIATGYKDDLQIRNIKLIVKFYSVWNIVRVIVTLLAIFGGSVGLYNYWITLKTIWEKP